MQEVLEIVSLTTLFFYDFLIIHLGDIVR